MMVSFIDSARRRQYICRMRIEALSTGLAQSRLMDEVGTRVLKMSMGMVSDEAAALAKLMESANQDQYTYPAIGSQVNILV